METIDLIKEVEQKAVSMVFDAQKKREGELLKAQEKLEESIKRLPNDLKLEVSSIIEKAKIEAEGAKKREVEKRTKEIIDLESSSRQNIKRATSFILDKLIK
ncbi:MAG: hypothetical protein KY054_00615 [Candidatus Nealsonbacteria bacterium]|nr:hypothetical protein [Candidatus Nealsonbacteria bacterium]